LLTSCIYIGLELGLLEIKHRWEVLSV